MKKLSMAVLVWGAAGVVSTSAWAQDPYDPAAPAADPAVDPMAPAPATEAPPPPPPEPAPQPEPEPVQAQATYAVPPPAPPPAQVDAGQTDHDGVVGSFAVGYFGVSQIPLLTAGGGDDSVSAPAIGVRYWFTDMVGLDVALGLHIDGGSFDDGDTSTDLTTRSGFLLHAGVPLALSCGQHFCFEVIPEVNAGFASATDETAAGDVDRSGNRIDLGARVGGELQFGFIGVPQLALVGSVGLYYTRRSASVDPPGPGEQTATTFQLSSTVESDPWALFTNSISALYYF